MIDTFGINLRIALKALTQNRLQAVLTLCGMSVGVAMVVIVGGLGHGAQATIEAQLESAGPTEITIRAGNFVPAGALTSGEQDSSGGEPGEGSESVFDLPSDSRRRPDARGTHGIRHRTPALPLGAAELDLVRTNVPNVRAVAAGVEGNVRLAASADAVATEAAREAEASGAAVATASANGDGTFAAALPTVRVARVHGIDAMWVDIRGWKVIAGRVMTPAEYAGSAPVALLTPGAARRLWPGLVYAGAPASAKDAAGGDASLTAAILARRLSLALPAAPSAAATATATVAAPGGRDAGGVIVVRVIGVLRPFGDERDSAIVPSIYVPLGVAQRLLGRTTFDRITVQSASVAATTSVAREIVQRLRALRQLPADTIDDFRVETASIAALPTRGVDPRLARAVHANVVGFEQASYEEIARSLRQAGRTLTFLLVGTAAVSLVVGGIGVMNIMLVSVASRTREIGLRMAMGARTADVLTQFLAEAVALASLGGVVGLALGSAGLAAARHGLRWATAVSPGMLLLALAVAGLTGVAFGFGPARRAAALDPVVALRCE